MIKVRKLLKKWES